MNIKSINDRITICECIEVIEFLREISWTGEMFIDNSSNSIQRHHGYLFRGQSDSRYKLIPNALRTDKKLKFFNGVRAEWKIPETNRDQVVAEMTMLRAFYVRCNEQGLQIPENSAELVAYLSSDNVEQFRREQELYFPSKIILPFLALAQHYGIPTRLLDWTRNPYKAAYFAAKNVLAKNTSLTGKYIAVWAWDLYPQFIGEKLQGTQTHPIKLLQTPYYGNENILAQEGRLSLITTKLDLNDPVDRTALEEFPKDQGKVRLLCFTLPYNKVSELLTSLAYLRITANEIFPGHQGAAEAVLEDQYYSKHLNPLYP